MISVFIGTWNMGEEGWEQPTVGCQGSGVPPDCAIPTAGSVPPPKNITSWITSKGLGKTLDEVTMAIPHDIYVFGTQENSLGDKEWVDFLRTVLKDFTEVEYRPVRARGSRGPWGLRGAGTGGWWRCVMPSVLLGMALLWLCDTSCSGVLSWCWVAVGAPGLLTPGLLGWFPGAGYLWILMDGGGIPWGTARGGRGWGEAVMNIPCGHTRGAPMAPGGPSVCWQGAEGAGTHRWPCSPCGTSRWWCW